MCHSVCWLVIETSLTFISSLVCSQPVHSDLQLVNNVMWWFSENFVQGYFELTLIVGAVLPLKWCKITNLRFAFEMLFPPVNWKCTVCNKSRNIFDKLPVTVFRRALKKFFFEAFGQVCFVDYPCWSFNVKIGALFFYTEMSAAYKLHK